MKIVAMATKTPEPIIDRPLPYIHFRLTVKGWHPLIALPLPVHEQLWQAMYDIGIRQVLRLRGSLSESNPTPLRVLGMVAMQDLEGGDVPDDSRFEEMLVNQAARFLRVGLREGGTAVLCVGGCGRTCTVIGGFLHTLGMPAKWIVRLLDRAYKDAGRSGWPAFLWQAEVSGRIGPRCGMSMDAHAVGLRSLL